jgi:hypothetical protein
MQGEKREEFIGGEGEEENIIRYYPLFIYKIMSDLNQNIK